MRAFRFPEGSAARVHSVRLLVAVVLATLGMPDK
jgi:hypothetical protein